MLRKRTSLGLLSRLSREIRDAIYDLCHQEKGCSINRRPENNPGTLRFFINVQLSQMRLVNSQLKSEYESRAHSNAIMVQGGLMHCC